MNGIRLQEVPQEKQQEKQRALEFVYAGRFDFYADTERKIQQVGENTDICHRVSFRLMADALINALNFFLSAIYRNAPRDAALAGETIHYVRGIISAVAGIYPSFGENLAVGLKRVFEGKEPYEFFLKIIEETLKSDLDLLISMFCVESCLNHILDLMNNEAYNLKRGDRSTNRSIGAAFDAFEVPEKREDLGGLLLGSEDSKVATMLIHATKGGGVNFDESALHIILVRDDNKEVFIQSSVNEFYGENVHTLDMRLWYSDFLAREVRDFTGN